jgi:hypothetical protein
VPAVHTLLQVSDRQALTAEQGDGNEEEEMGILRAAEAYKFLDKECNEEVRQELQIYLFLFMIKESQRTGMNISEE